MMEDEQNLNKNTDKGIQTETFQKYRETTDTG